LTYMPLPLDLPPTEPHRTAERPTVAFVGRLHPIKGIDTLIEAVAIARRDVPDIRLEIVGPGDRYRRTLEALGARLGVDDALIFHGFVEVSEKLRVLRSAHVSALLSQSEGLPMAALEAMACGTPVVLSHGCHLDEIHEQAGLVTPGSADGAAAALVRMLTDAPLRRRFSGGAVTFAERFRRETVMPQMIAVLQDLAASRR
jgi:polysaccharide biosynthesis protein PelF